MSIEGMLVTKASAEVESLVRQEIRRCLDRANQEIGRTYAAIRDDMALEAEGRLEMLEGAIGDLNAKLAPMFAAPEWARLIRNYGIEAAREVTEERYRMIVAAAGGAVDPRMTIEQKARVERTLRELDPADLVSLYALWHPRLRTSLRDRWHAAAESGDALVAAGCVALDLEQGQAPLRPDSRGLPIGARGGEREFLPTPPATQFPRVTALGIRVLRATYHFIQTLPFPVNLTAGVEMAWIEPTA